MDTDNALAIYKSSFDTGLTKSAITALASPSFERLTDIIGTAAADSELGAYEVLQSTFDRAIELISIETLIKSAPLHMQRELDATALSALVADSNNGLAVKFPLLIELPQVARYPDGTIELIGGNHRLATIVYTLHRAEIDEDTILSQELQVLVTSVNMESLKGLLGDAASQLTDYQLSEIASKTLKRMWFTSNGSRRVSTGEAKEYKTFSNKPRTVEGITAAFQASEITAKDAFSLLSPYTAQKVCPPQDEVTSASVFPMDAFVDGAHTMLTLDTVTGILNSAWTKTAGSKAYSKAVKQDGLFAVNAILSLVLTSSNAFSSKGYFETDATDEEGNPIVELQGIECNMLQHAIDTVVNQLKADNNKYASNIARNKSAIGSALAELMIQTPLFSKYAERSIATKSSPVVVKSAAWNY
jgi:hypothetical protein